MELIVDLVLVENFFNVFICFVYVLEVVCFSFLYWLLGFVEVICLKLLLEWWILRGYRGY